MPLPMMRIRMRMSTVLPPYSAGIFRITTHRHFLTSTSLTPTTTTTRRLSSSFPAAFYHRYGGDSDLQFAAPFHSQQQLCLTKATTLDESLSLFYELDPSSKSARVCNPLLKSLLKLGRTDDARQLLDQMLQPDSKFPPDDFTGEIVFGDLVKRDCPGKGLADEEIVKRDKL